MNVNLTDIRDGLRAMGLKPGAAVLVHSSLSSFGHVVGGAETVINALLEIIGNEGVALFPTLTGNESLSITNPPVFDLDNTPCWTGIIPETARTKYSSVRSHHPTHSVTAIGRNVNNLLNDHFYSLTPCDEFSPYGKLAKLDKSYILLLGVTHQSSTIFHHVEEIAGVDYHMQHGFVKSKLILGDIIVFRHYMLHKYGTHRNFNIMESVFLEREIQVNAKIGEAEVKLIKANQMVEITLQALRANKNILCIK